jgi:UDP-2,3-diacylglucosamine pyrophosphatase LpxH
MLAFDALYAVSDLHIGGAADFRIFDDGDALAALVDVARADAAARVAFVVNGDVFDFLAAPGAVPFSPERALAHLTQVLLPDPRFAGLFAALLRFTSTPARTLVINTGNHDIELGAPAVQRALGAAIQGRATPIVWHTHQEGFACTVGNKRVVCVHGNDTDDWNRVDAGYVDAPNDPAPNAGSMLVTMVMNRVKERFRFIDVLKPEGLHLAALALALDDDTSDPLLDLAAVRALRAVLARRAKDTRESGVELAVEDAALAAAVDAELALRAHDAAALEQILPFWPLKMILRSMLDARQFWSVSAPDDQWRALARSPRFAAVDVLIAGHTHAPREGPLALGSAPTKTHYINTATWAFIMTLSDADFSDDGFRVLEAQLRTRGAAGFSLLERAGRLVRPRRYAYVDGGTSALRTFAHG